MIKIIATGDPQVIHAGSKLVSGYLHRYIPVARAKYQLPGGIIQLCEWRLHTAGYHHEKRVVYRVRKNHQIISNGCS